MTGTDTAGIVIYCNQTLGEEYSPYNLKSNYL